ncbi:hypothetical protein [Photobacterium damselae]|uniref:hypothetical protein n=1 Tax=Photobacterium damselae TaxID=38293 RepID=UPI004067A373
MNITTNKLIRLIKTNPTSRRVSASIDIESSVEMNNGEFFIIKAFAGGFSGAAVNGNKITLHFSTIDSEKGGIDIIKAVDPIVKSSPLLMDGLFDYNINYPTTVTNKPFETKQATKNHPTVNLTTSDLIPLLELIENDDELEIDAIVDFATATKNNLGKMHHVKLFCTDLIDVLSTSKEMAFQFESSHSEKGNVDIAKASEVVISSSKILMAGGLDNDIRYPEPTI